MVDWLRAIFKKIFKWKFSSRPFWCLACFFLARVPFFNVMLDKCQIATIPEAQRFRFWKMGATYEIYIYIIDRSKHVYVATYLRDFPVNGISARNWYALHAMPKEFYVDGSTRREKRVTHSLYIHKPIIDVLHFIHRLIFLSHSRHSSGMLDFILREESLPQTRKFYIISALLQWIHLIEFVFYYVIYNVRYWREKSFLHLIVSFQTFFFFFQNKMSIILGVNLTWKAWFTDSKS